MTDRGKAIRDWIAARHSEGLTVYAQTPPDMRPSEFVTLCRERGIDPTVALETESVRAALRKGRKAGIVAAMDKLKGES